MSAPRPSWFSSLWLGRTTPGAYLATGTLLALGLMLVEAVAARMGFDRRSPLASYVVTGDPLGLLALGRDDRDFLLTMLLISAPFLAAGLLLTLRRLRDARWPLGLSAFILAPTPINVVFFAVLSQIPSRDGPAGGLEDEIDGPLPEKGPGPAGFREEAARVFLAITVPLVAVAAAGYVATYVLRDYGLALFVGLPFLLPMLSVVLYGFGRGVTLGRAVQIGCLSALVAVLLMLGLAFEGIICLLLLFPMAAPIVFLGAVFGWVVVELGPKRAGARGKLVAILFALIPALVGAEHLAAPEPLRFTCETSIEVDAPPEAVWRHVVSFSDLDPPDDWVFRTGLAYPIRARIDGSGVGAVRRCEFSTGTFVEPIEAWDEPRLLRFSVESGPPPMREWSPLFEAHPPHLDGFLVSERGQFELIPRPGGGTLLRGSTLYRHGLWPAAYWRLWSDPIIHRIHDRVLRHIKRLAETGPRGRPRAPAPGASPP